MYSYNKNIDIIINIFIIMIFLAFVLPKKYKAKTLFAVSIIFFIGFIIINNRQNQEPFSNKCNNLYNWSIGPYSDLTLKPNNSISDQFPLIDPSNITVYQAHGIPLKDKHKQKPDPYLNDSPTVDGTKDGLKTNFMFAYNQSSPLCCPSPYSTSTGCVCLTENQRNFIGNRGTMYGK